MDFWIHVGVHATVYNRKLHETHVVDLNVVKVTQ